MINIIRFPFPYIDPNYAPISRNNSLDVHYLHYGITPDQKKKMYTNMFTTVEKKKSIRLFKNNRILADNK
jgi:hypothetical protein